MLNIAPAACKLNLCPIRIGLIVYIIRTTDWSLLVGGISWGRFTRSWGQDHGSCGHIYPRRCYYQPTKRPR